MRIFVTLVTALSLSGVAAYYSIIGITTIYPGAVIPVSIMGIVLESSKLVAISWLYHNWNTPYKTLKRYLIFGVAVLMIVTSVGTFGFLAKAHLEHNASGDNVLAKIEQIDVAISRQQRIIDDSNRVIEQLDGAVETLMKYDRIRGKDGAISIRNSQKEERNGINKEIESAQKEIDRLLEIKFPMEQEKRNVELDVGPALYIAEMLYGDQASLHIDGAVRIVTLILVVVFDPMAVALLIAANISIANRPSKPKKRKRRTIKRDNTLEIPEENITTIEEDVSVFM